MQLHGAQPSPLKFDIRLDRCLLTVYVTTTRVNGSVRRSASSITALNYTCMIQVLHDWIASEHMYVLYTIEEALLTDSRTFQASSTSSSSWESVSHTLLFSIFIL